MHVAGIPDWGLQQVEGEGEGEGEEEEEEHTFRAMTCSRHRAISSTGDCVASVQEEDHIRSMP